MSQLTLLANWIAENVRAVPEEQRNSGAARLAAEFKAYARDAGLGVTDIEELEEDIGEDLVSHMEDALEAAEALTDETSPDDAE